MAALLWSFTQAEISRAKPVTSCWSAKSRINRSRMRRAKRLLSRTVSVIFLGFHRSGRRGLSLSAMWSRTAAAIEARVVIMADTVKEMTTYIRVSKAISILCLIGSSHSNSSNIRIKVVYRRAVHAVEAARDIFIFFIIEENTVANHSR